MVRTLPSMELYIVVLLRAHIQFSIPSNWNHLSHHASPSPPILHYCGTNCVYRFHLYFIAWENFTLCTIICTCIYTQHTNPNPNPNPNSRLHSPPHHVLSFGPASQRCLHRPISLCDCRDSSSCFSYFVNAIFTQSLLYQLFTLIHSTHAHKHIEKVKKREKARVSLAISQSFQWREREEESLKW